MKTVHFTIIAVTVLLLVPMMMNNQARAICMPSSDWPSAPCYGCPGCIPSKEKQREEWNPYYQYKGASWMEIMKTQMIEAMKNGTIEDWVTGNDSNYDVWRYYYLNDQAPFFRSSVSGLNDEHPYFPPPLQQLKTGITPKDVVCKVGLELMIKTNDGLPVCVRYPTANVLLERGLTKETISAMTSHETTIIIPTNSSVRSNGFTFTPSLVKVVIGTNNTVRWINMDSVTNDITSSSVSFRSGLIESGYAWTHTFDKSGMYRYYSTIHTWLKGIIIVENNTSSASISSVSSISSTTHCPSGLTMVNGPSGVTCIITNPAAECSTGYTVKLISVRSYLCQPTNPPTLSNPTTYYVGQKAGVFTISKINQYNVTGYYNSPYPIGCPGLGDFTIMHLGDTLNPTCDGSAPHVITAINYPNSITVSIGKSTGPAHYGCPICLSANSEIKTPNGDVNIKDIKDGMTVWSTDLNGMMIKSKVIKINNVFVGDMHKVIDLQLSDGRELFASPNHSTYDNRIVAELKIGETYDESTVKSLELVPYTYQFTYDVLPDSPTGNYFANGVLVGSTLK